MEAAAVGGVAAMLRRSAVLGLAAMGQADGRPAGRVADLLFNTRGDRVIGLLLQGGTWWRRRLIPYEEVAAIGSAAVMLRNPVVLSGPNGRVRRLRRTHAGALGLRVLTREGHDAGIVDDVCFEPSSGSVLGYLVSAGLVADVLHGQGFLPIARVRALSALPAPPACDLGVALGPEAGAGPERAEPWLLTPPV